MANQQFDVSNLEGLADYSRLTFNAALHIAIQTQCEIVSGNRRDPEQVCVSNYWRLIDILRPNESADFSEAFTRVIQECRRFVDEYARNDAAIVCLVDSFSDALDYASH